MRFRPAYLGCIAIVLVCGCDQKLWFDANGHAHGTGEEVYAYTSGAPKLREEYKHGKIIRSRWFKPDGTLIQETDWENGTGEGIYLREDGSIKQRMQYVNGIAEGEAMNYDETGRATKVSFHAGKPVPEASAATSQPGG